MYEIVKHKKTDFQYYYGIPEGFQIMDYIKNSSNKHLN